MSSEVEEKSSSETKESPIQVIHKDKRLRRFLYSRDFLLSLSGLDICKKLPKGFDVSLLSELEDASNNAFETQRNLGGTYFQKRNEYGLHPHRLESSSSYSRGSYGRWDTRSSGSSDREELQSDCNSDSGRRYLNPSRRSWQHPEHDGLLGKPSGHSGQTSMQRSRANGSFQLNKSTEPYQPPRPNKAAPYSPSITDLRNDETFGASECSSKERAEEEKRRRESFELMRREQHKLLQEKQKDILIKHKENLDDKISGLLENHENAQVAGDDSSKNNLLPPASQQNVSRAFVQQAPASRPLVPPGFKSTAVEKKCFPTSNTSFTTEVEKLEYEDKSSSKAANGVDDISNKDVNGDQGTISSGVEVPVLLSNHMSYDPSIRQEGTKGWKDSVDNDSTDNEVMKIRDVEVVGQDQPTSILDKLFQSALTRKGSGLSDFIEHQSLEADDEPKSSSLLLSSKFVQFFNQDEKKSVKDALSDELSINKGGHQESPVIDANVVENVPSDFPVVNTEVSRDFSFTKNSVEGETQEQYYHCTGKPSESSDMLTCEYIEQLLLAEANLESNSSQQYMLESSTELDAKPETQNGHVDDHASQHLLSLLQQGTNMQDSTTLVHEDMVKSSGSLFLANSVTSYNESRTHDGDAEATSLVKSAENSLTLETLFGTAFMKELQSAEAPVSAQRDSNRSSITASVPDPLDLQFSHDNDVNGLFSSLTRRYCLSTSDGTSMSACTPEMESSKNQENWVGSVSLQDADIHLPEEENLITGVDGTHPRNFDFSPLESGAKDGDLILSNQKDNIINKLAALNSIPLNDRTLLPPGVNDSHPLHGPYHQSIPHFPHNLISQTRPLVQKLDHHAQINPQTNFMGPDSIHPDLRHPYPPNMIHHHSLSNPGGSRFDDASHFQMLQHIQMSRNFPPPHVHDYPRGVPPYNHVSRNHELNQMNPFPLHHPQQGYGGLRMEIPGFGIGAVNHPETIESLYQMEMRANSRHNNFAPGGPIPGSYGPEIDMGFRFR